MKRYMSVREASYKWGDQKAACVSFVRQGVFRDYRALDVHG